MREILFWGEALYNSKGGASVIRFLWTYLSQSFFVRKEKNTQYSRVCKSDNIVPWMYAICSVSWFAISNVWICTAVWRRTRTICGLSDGTAGNLAGCYCPPTPLCWLIFCWAALCIFHTFRHPAARSPIGCTCCRGFENQLTVLPPSRRILRRKKKKKVNNDNRQRIIHENKRWTFATATTRRRHAVTNATAIAVDDGQWNSKSSVWKHCHRAIMCVGPCVRYECCSRYRYNNKYMVQWTASTRELLTIFFSNITVSKL